MCKSGAIDAMGLLGPQGDSSIEFNRRREEEAFNGRGDGGAAIWLPPLSCKSTTANKEVKPPNSRPVHWKTMNFRAKITWKIDFSSSSWHYFKYLRHSSSSKYVFRLKQWKKSPNFFPPFYIFWGAAGVSSRQFSCRGGAAPPTLSCWLRRPAPTLLQWVR